jgi:thioredoxin reductase (NADPH)
MNDTPHNVVIIGAGPAGLTAGIYTARAGLKPLLIAGDNPGGQLMKTTFVENWPGEKSIVGPKLMINILEHAKSLGCAIKEESVTSVDFSASPFTITTNRGTIITTQSVIIATGASPNRLGCPGETEFWGHGITTCAVCDGAFYKDKRVIVIGGGDTAMEDASFLKKFTDKITIIQNKQTLSASKAMQDRVLSDPSIKVIYNSSVSMFKGSENILTHAIIKDLNTGVEEELPVDGVFLAIGMRPNSTIFKEFIECDAWGYIVRHDNTKTSREGVFVAGDVADYTYRQAIVAAADGCKAALDTERYLHITQFHGKS